jgi:hypothetical protein
LYDNFMTDDETPSLDELLASVGIHVTEEGKAHARAALRAAEARSRTPEAIQARAALLARLRGTTPAP